MKSANAISDSLGVEYAPPARRADGKWHVTRYADVARALREPRLSAERGATWHTRAPHPLLQTLRRWTRAEGAVAELRGHWLALNDPPEHTRLRSIVQPIWTKHIRREHERIGALIQEQVVHLAGAGTVELNERFASPVSLQLAAMLLGLPLDIPPEIVRALLDIKVLFGTIRDASARQLAQANHMVEYVARVIAHKRIEPADDLISALITAQHNGAALDDAELTALVLLLLITAYRTPFYFLGGALELVLQDAHSFEIFRGTKSERALATEELLRVTTSADSTERIVKTEMELGGAHLARGETLYLNLLAANHDAAQFSAPDELNFTRAPNPHLAFGAGAHVCLGAGLARLEAELVFGAIAGMIPQMQLLAARAHSNHLSHRYKPAELWVRV